MELSLLRRFGRTTLAGAALGAAGSAGALGVDRALGTFVGIATGNARALLAAAFGAVVTVGTFSFWMRPVAAQLAASALPPQWLVNHLHDRFQARVIAATVGVLGYLAVVLLALPSGGDEPAPVVSTVVGTVLATGAVGALLVAMYQADRSTRPNTVVAEAAQDVIRRLRVAAMGDDELQVATPHADGAQVVADGSGWVADIDVDGLIGAVGSGTTIALHTHVGAFVVDDWTVIASVWPATAADEAVRRRLATCVHVADQRIDAQDLSGAVSQFVDIGVHAATAATASPSTVDQTLRWVGTVLHELGRHGRLGNEDVTTEDGRSVVRQRMPDAADLADMVVTRMRQVLLGDPARSRALAAIVADAERGARQRCRPAVADALRRQLTQIERARRHGDGRDA